ncbi:MAG: hypothetical protein L0G22_09615 [Propionibacteriaceae bacterium]|nr:hypothetical protein [Propionibacteriaceae bacterium]
MSREPHEILRDALAHFDTMQAHADLLVDSAIIRQTLAQDIPTIIDRIRGRLGLP